MIFKNPLKTATKKSVEKKNPELQKESLYDLKLLAATV